MDDTYMPVDALQPRGIYWLTSRNLVVGVWDPDRKGFVGIRHKFGSSYLFTEYHYDSDPHFGTAMPVEVVTEVVMPEGMLLADDLPGSWCGDQLDREVRHYRDEKLWRHLEDGSQCSKPTRLPNAALHALLEPLDQKRRAELYG